jgi:hypothetical protein
VQTFCRFFVDKETEQNWGERDAAIHKFRGAVLGIDKEFLKGVIGLQDVIKPIMEPLSQTVLYRNYFISHLLDQLTPICTCIFIL